MFGSILGNVFGGILGIAGLGQQAAAQREANEINSQLSRENMQLQRDINDQNLAFQREANAQNLAFQRETNAQNEALMRESWSREDTAASRRAADLESAGLSKTLAAGGAASSSAPVRLESPRVSALDAGIAPQNSYKHNPVSLDFMNLSQMSQEFATKVKENKILDSQRQELDAKVSQIDEQTKKIKTETEIDEIKKDMLEAQYDDFIKNPHKYSLGLLNDFSYITGYDLREGTSNLVNIVKKGGYDVSPITKVPFKSAYQYRFNGYN